MLTNLKLQYNVKLAIYLAMLIKYKLLVYVTSWFQENIWQFQYDYSTKSFQTRL